MSNNRNTFVGLKLKNILPYVPNFKLTTCMLMCIGNLSFFFCLFVFFNMVFVIKKAKFGDKGKAWRKIALRMSSN